MLEQRSHQASEQRPSMFGLPTELSALFSVAHVARSFSFLGPPDAMASSLTPRLRPMSVKISLISFNDFLPKFFVFSISASDFCTRSAIVLMLAFFKQFAALTDNSSSFTLR